jgi:hypothetical protein
MHVLDTALSHIAEGKDPRAVLKENNELEQWFEEQAFVTMVIKGNAPIRAFRREAFPMIKPESNEPSPWVLLDYDRYDLHRMLLALAIADQAKYARMAVQKNSLVSGAAIDVENAQELTKFKKILDRGVDYKKGIVDHQRLGKAIEKYTAKGFEGRISLWDRQFPKDLEANYPCDFKTSPVGVPLEAGEGEDGRRRYCFVLARESTLGKSVEELTVRNSLRVRNLGVREELRPHVEKIARRFEAMAPWRTPTLKRVDQMVSAYAPLRLGKKNLPPVSRP